MRTDLHRVQVIEQQQEYQKLNERAVSLYSPSTSTGTDQNVAKVHLINGEGTVIQTRLVSLDGCDGFEHVLEKVKSKFDMDHIRLKYRDEEGDLITMCDESDYLAALRASSDDLSSRIRLRFWCHAL